MTPEEYRKRWGLPDDYPMVAPSYAQQRSDLAKKIGLGTKRSSSSGRVAAERCCLTSVCQCGSHDFSVRSVFTFDSFAISAGVSAGRIRFWGQESK